MINYYTLHNNLDRYTFNEEENKGFQCKPVNICLIQSGKLSPIFCNIIKRLGLQTHRQMCNQSEHSLLDEPQQRTTASKPKTKQPKAAKPVTPQAPAQVTPVPPAPTKTNIT